jgi:hypothetical protein
VHDVARPVELVGPLGPHEPAAEEGERGRLGGRGEQALEPGRLGECVRVQEGDPVAVGGTLDRQVVRAREADVLAQAEELDPEMAPLERVDGAVGRRVVDDDDARGGVRLALERVEAAVEEGAAVQVDDDDRDARGGPGEGLALDTTESARATRRFSAGLASAPARPEPGTSRPVAKMPA